MGSTSGAVCMPSRGMLMTGRNLFDTLDPLPDDIPLLPELLRGERLHYLRHGQMA